MKTDEIKIIITSKPGQDPYRAKMYGSKVIATSTMSAEWAAHAVAKKHWPGKQVTVERVSAGEYRAMLVTEHMKYAPGDRIRFQTDGMPEPSEALVTCVGATGLKLDGNPHLFARWHEIIGKVAVPDSDAAPAAETALAIHCDNCSKPAPVSHCDNCSSIQTLLKRDGVTLNKPDTTADAKCRLTVTLQVGMRADLQTALLMVWGLELSGEKTTPWVTQTAEDLHIGERQVYTYLRAGRLLLSDDFAALPRAAQERLMCGSEKLQILARLLDTGRGNLVCLLEHNDPREINCQQVEDLVKQYLQKLLPPVEPDADEAAEVIEKKMFAQAREALKAVGAIPESKLQDMAKRNGPVTCTNQGIRLAAGGLLAMSSLRPEDTVLALDWKETLQEMLEKLSALTGQKAKE